MFRDRTDAGRRLADLLRDLDVETDEMNAVETPPHFSAVCQFYGSFPQVSDAEAASYLEG